MAMPSESSDSGSRTGQKTCKAQSRDSKGREHLDGSASAGTRVTLVVRAGGDGGPADIESTGRKQSSGGTTLGTLDRWGPSEREGNASWRHRRGGPVGSAASQSGGHAGEGACEAAGRDEQASGRGSLHSYGRAAASAEQALENWCIALSYWEHATYTRAVYSWRHHVDSLRAAAVHLLRPGGLLVRSMDVDAQRRSRETYFRRASGFMHGDGHAPAIATSSVPPGCPSDPPCAPQHPVASRAKMSKEEELAFLSALDCCHRRVLHTAVTAWRAICAHQRKALSRAQQLAAISCLAACLSHWHLSHRSRKELSLSLRCFFLKSMLVVKGRVFAAWASFSAHVVEVVACMVRLRINRTWRMQALILALWRLHFVPWQRQKRLAVGSSPRRLEIVPHLH